MPKSKDLPIILSFEGDPLQEVTNSIVILLGHGFNTKAVSQNYEHADLNGYVSLINFSTGDKPGKSSDSFGADTETIRTLRPDRVVGGIRFMYSEQLMMEKESK